VGHFAFKLIEWVAGFAANGNGFVAFTDGDRLSALPKGEKPSIILIC
jgi:hypothetical protein